MHTCRWPHSTQACEAAGLADAPGVTWHTHCARLWCLPVSAPFGDITPAAHLTVIFDQYIMQQACSMSYNGLAFSEKLVVKAGMLVMLKCCEGAFVQVHAMPSDFLQCITVP